MFKHESFQKTGFTLGSSSAKTRFALLPEGMPFRIMLAPDKSMRRKSCRWFPGARSAMGVPTASDAGDRYFAALSWGPLACKGATSFCAGQVASRLSSAPANPSVENFSGCASRCPSSAWAVSVKSN
jgi:hypothetical protein